MKISHLFGLILFTLFISVSLAAAIDDAPSELKLGPDQYIAGQTVTIDQPVSGDVVAAGDIVRVTADIGGDLIVFARSVTVDGAVGGSIRGAAQTFQLNGSVTKTAMLAGLEINLNAGNEASIGNVVLGAGTIQLNRPIDGYAMIGGQSVTINEPILGSTRLSTEFLDLGQNSRFNSGVTYRKVNDGQSQDTNISRLRTQGAEVVVLDAPANMAVQSWPQQVLNLLLMMVQLLVTGLILLWLIPKTIATLAHDQVNNLWLVLFFGIFGLPVYLIVALALTVSTILTPVGLGLILLAPIFLMIGFTAALLNIGHRMAKTDLKPVQSLILGSIILFLLEIIPLVGPLVMVIIFVLVTGGLWLSFLRKVKAVQ